MRAHPARREFLKRCRLLRRRPGFRQLGSRLTFATWTNEKAARFRRDGAVSPTAPPQEQTTVAGLLFPIRGTSDRGSHGSFLPSRFGLRYMGALCNVCSKLHSCEMSVFEEETGDGENVHAFLHRQRTYGGVLISGRRREKPCGRAYAAR